MKELSQAKAKTVHTVTRIDAGVLFHSPWFALVLPLESMPSLAKVPVEEAPVPWKETAWPSDTPAFEAAASAYTHVTPEGSEERLVRFSSSVRPDLVAYMRPAVFSWVQEYYADPTFAIRGVDQVIAVLDAGKLVGGVGPVKL